MCPSERNGAQVSSVFRLFPVQIKNMEPTIILSRGKSKKLKKFFERKIGMTKRPPRNSLKKYEELKLHWGIIRPAFHERINHSDKLFLDMS